MLVHIHTRNTYLNLGDIIINLEHFETIFIKEIKILGRSIFELNITLTTRESPILEAYDTLEDTKKRMAYILTLLGMSDIDAEMVVKKYDHTAINRDQFSIDKKSYGDKIISALPEETKMSINKLRDILG
jgi:hypothetical protein